MTSHKATRIDLFSLATPQMRAFHLAWLAFFVCFFAWFAIAPLMPVIKGDFHLTMPQIANINIAAVSITILARLVIGPLCDRYGPRIAYTALLVVGAIPVIGIAFATTYESFLVFRLAIGAIGASFVITQYQTSVMFAPNVVGTANAAVGGWGNAGGGVTQTVMPLVLAAAVSAGLSQSVGWRVSMVVPGVLMLVVAALYWRFGQDTPEGNIPELRRRGMTIETGKKGGLAVMREAAANYRVWCLAVCYGAAFGIELFIHTVSATYYVSRFHLTLKMAGLAAGSFGLLALFARALGGYVSDRIARSKGLDGRTWLLFALLIGEGAGLMAFSQMDTVETALAAMLAFGLFTHMSCGAIYALVPFVDRRALGGVTGIVGAGGNVGAVAAGFLLKGVGSLPVALFDLGTIVLVCSLCAASVRFSRAHKAAEQALYDEAVAQRFEGAPAAA
jgi:NNP family nitrate/nitrite transporter-like MFS transporter